LLVVPVSAADVTLRCSGDSVCHQRDMSFNGGLAPAWVHLVGLIRSLSALA
jgi:hypothetical protein